MPIKSNQKICLKTVKTAAQKKKLKLIYPFKLKQFSSTMMKIEVINQKFSLSTQHLFFNIFFVYSLMTIQHKKINNDFSQFIRSNNNKKMRLLQLFFMYLLKNILALYFWVFICNINCLPLVYVFRDIIRRWFNRG